MIEKYNSQIQTHPRWKLCNSINSDTPQKSTKYASNKNNTWYSSTFCILNTLSESCVSINSSQSCEGNSLISNSQYTFRLLAIYHVPSDATSVEAYGNFYGEFLVLDQMWPRRKRNCVVWRLNPGQKHIHAKEKVNEIEFPFTFIYLLITLFLGWYTNSISHYMILRIVTINYVILT